MSRKYGYRKNYKKKAVSVPSKAKTTRNYTTNNAKAINRMSKQIHALKMSKYGPVQKNFQTTTRQFYPSFGRPVCMDLCDFTSTRATPAQQGCIFYQFNNAAPSTLVQASTWTTTGTRQLNNPFWVGQNSDFPNTGQYLPIYVKLTCTALTDTTVGNVRIRVDLISYKKSKYVPTFGAQPSTIMPDAIQHLDGLSRPNQYRINQTYFKIYQTKFMYINNQNRPGSAANPVSHGTTGSQTFCSFVVKPKQPRNQDLTTPLVDRTSPEIPDGNFGPLNVDITQPLWAIFSVDQPDQAIPTPEDPNPPLPNVFIRCSRKCVWRDTLGSSAV